MLGGIAVNALGHAHPAVVEAVSRQVRQLGHVSNLYIAEPPVALAELLLVLAGRPGKVYFGNSGAEAVEAAYKISRRTGRAHVVAAAGGFHGRTMGALSLTGQPAKTDPFRPLPGPVTHVPYGDADALAAAVTDETAMVILEPRCRPASAVPATGLPTKCPTDPTRASNRTSSRWPRASVADCRSARASRSARRPTFSARARTARRSAETR
jgi:adenosylmethionine-8-amino-7-oxononanoate aminotransferase